MQASVFGRVLRTSYRNRHQLGSPASIEPALICATPPPENLIPLALTTRAF